jgi:hypothetical protein
MMIMTMMSHASAGCVPPSFSVVLSQLHRDIMQQVPIITRLHPNILFYM